MFRAASLSLAVLLISPAVQAAEGLPPAREEAARLQAEIAALRAEFAARLEALEARLKTLEAAPAPAVAASPAPAPGESPAPAVAEAPPPPPVEPAPPLPSPPAEPVPAMAAAAQSSKVFNPDIAVIGSFVGTAGQAAFPDAPPALEMREVEASFQAVVDPYARADFFLTFGPDEVGIEEGYITFPTVPGGLLLKAGKLRDAFGKVNAMHTHVLPWTDRPLVSENLTGGEEGLSDSGISVSRLIQNRLLFLEATAQVYAGNSAVFSAPSRSDLAYVGHLRAYRDLGESSNLDLGGSFAWGHNGVTDESTTRLWGVDATFRWRPLRRAIYRRFLARTELVWSRRQGEASAPAQDAFGLYGSAEYQFARRWYLGARYDWSERAADAALRDRGASLQLSWWPSEFSQIRGQYRRTQAAEGQKADEFLFQFLFSIGAHGAHPF